MGKTLVAIGLAVFLALFTAATIHAADCQFVLGFKTLRDLIGHDIVGECLEGEHYNAIGDSVQQTTGGLLAWRKADNWTAFTDGYRTWVNGPNGLQQRLNTERFEWEADYASFATPEARPTPAPSQNVDPILANAYHVMRSTVIGNAIADVFIGLGANALFSALGEPMSRWELLPPRIIVNEVFRAESAEALAYVLIPPTAHLANYKNNGPPQSWDACMFSIVLHHGFQAEFWLQTFGKLGKANPTQLEQSANDRMARYLGGTLGNWVIEVPGYRQYCSYFGTPDDSTPAFVPTPTPSPSVFDDPRLDILLRFPETVARAAIAKQLGVEANSFSASQVVNDLSWRVRAMPYIFLMHMWATGGPESGHPLNDIEAFAAAYLAEPSQYASVAEQWLQDLISNPCIVPTEARNWVMQVETASTGALDSSISAAKSPGWAAEYAVKAAISNAQSLLYKDPNGYFNRYRCG